MEKIIGENKKPRMTYICQRDTLILTPIRRILSPLKIEWIGMCLDLPLLVSSSGSLENQRGLAHR